MIKPVKRNKRIKWINSRYALSYKRRLFLRNCQLATIAAQGIASIRTITTAIGQPALKKIAIAKSVINTATAINEILKQPIRR